MPEHAPAAPPDPGPVSAGSPRPQRYVFLLLDRFTLVSFAAAIEPLRLANRLSGRVLYDWRLVGAGGTSVRCSNGASMALDGDLLESQRGDTILVCGGVDVARAARLGKPAARQPQACPEWRRSRARAQNGCDQLFQEGWEHGAVGRIQGRRQETPEQCQWILKGCQTG